MPRDDLAGTPPRRRGVGDVDARRPRHAGRPPRSPPASRRRESPRAAATTVAPCARARSAIARPMPRDAPVTSGNLAGQIEHAHYTSRASTAARSVGPPKFANVASAMNLPAEAAQHRPWTHLNIRCGRPRTQGAAPRLPSAPAPTPAHQRLDGRRRVALRLGVHVRDDRHARVRGGQRPQFRRQPRPRPASSARSGTGALTGSGMARLAPSAFARSPGARHGVLRPGDHHLARRRSCSPGSRPRPAPPPRTPARPWRRRGRGSPPSRPARPAPPPACSGPRRRTMRSASAKRERAGRHVGRVLAEAVAGDERRRRRPRDASSAVARRCSRPGSPAACSR